MLLLNKPRVLLLDEPLAALDLKLRQKMLMELDLIHDEVGITFLFVTHDQTEAMAVSDRIAVFQLQKEKSNRLELPSSFMNLLRAVLWPHLLETQTF